MFDRHAMTPSPARAEQSRRIKDWARATLRLPEDATVMVSELRCTEPGCPPLETVVAILREGGGQAQFKIHRPLEEVVEDDVVRGAASLNAPERPRDPTP